MTSPAPSPVPRSPGSAARDRRPAAVPAPATSPSAGSRPPAHRPAARLARLLALAATVAGAALVPASGASAAPAQVPCTPSGGGHHDCRWYPAGDGHGGGTPVLNAAGTRVGFLHQGTNWIVCQQQGREQTAGGSHNHWWGFTTSDTGTTGWANAVYAKGGANDGSFSGVPACASRHGLPPTAAPPVQPAPTPPPAPAPPPAKPRYVALGDSFSSGEGAEDYYGAAPGRPAKCDRSSHAYGPRLAGRSSVKARFRFSQSTDFLACSGDEVPDLLKRQVPRMGTDIGAVTVSIGGNDAGFASVIKSCIANQHPGGKTCKSIIDDAFKTKLPLLRTRLDQAYSAIRAKAPNATVVVLAYPQIFEDSYRSYLCTSTALTRGARSDLRVAANTLDDTIEPIARAHGFTFADPRDAFDDHRICGSDTDWFHGIILNGNKAGSFHPTSAGQKGFADVISDAAPGAFG